MIVICTEKEREELNLRCRKTDCEECPMYNHNNCFIWNDENLLTVNEKEGVLYEAD